MWDFCVLGFFLFIEGTEMTVYEVRKKIVMGSLKV